MYNAGILSLARFTPLDNEDPPAMMVKFDTELYKFYERLRTELGKDVSVLLDSSLQLPAAKEVYNAAPYEVTGHGTYQTLPVVAQP